VVDKVIGWVKEVVSIIATIVGLYYLIKDHRPKKKKKRPGKGRK
jgi:hypothetical protein